MNEQRVDRLKFSLAHLAPVFAHRRAAQVSTSDVKKYTAMRLGAGAANATVNRGLAALRRAFQTGHHVDAAEAVHDTAHRHAEGGQRPAGFSGPARDRGRGPTPVPGPPPAYPRGLHHRVEGQLRVTTDDEASGGLRRRSARPGARDGEDEGGPHVPFTPDLRRILEEQRHHTTQLQRQRGAIISRVFHRNGRPIADFIKAWRKACVAAGVPGRVPHDMRRSAVRNTVQACPRWSP